MRLFSRFPVARLSPYIDRFWGWEAEAGETISLPTILPGTGAEMYFHYRTSFLRTQGDDAFSLPHAHLFCVRRRPVELAATTGLGFLAVRFRAGAIHHFTRLPGKDLLDQLPRAEDMWGASGKELANRVIEAVSNEERVQLLQAFLIRQLESGAVDALISSATAHLYRHCDTLSIEQLASHLHIGRRQLERRFLQLTGQTPIEVKRLSRFQKTARALLLEPSATCADSALAHGYFDQSHFIREFKSLTSLPPLAYFRQARLKTHFYNTSRPVPEKIHSTLST